MLETQTLLIVHRDKQAKQQLEDAITRQSVKTVNRLLKRGRVQLQFGGIVRAGRCDKFLNGQPHFNLWKQR